MAIIKGDRVLMAKGYGVKERGKPGAVTADTVFGRLQSRPENRLMLVIQDDGQGFDAAGS